MSIKLYKNKEWLKQKYVNEELSTTQIGKICNVFASIIHYWIRNYDISIRSRAEGKHMYDLRRVNHCTLSQEATEWINGELLGDGCLQSRSKYSANFQYGSKYLEYIKYIKNTLNSFEIELVGRIYKYYYKGMDCYIYQYLSRTYAELLPIQKRWYPNGKKIVPRDLKLTPITCRQWLIGDGSLIHQTKYGRSYLMLYTNGFPSLDVKWLVKNLNILGFKATRRSFNNSIGISVYSTQDFLNYVGPCPVKCYQYKWDYNKRKEV